jgi:U3 small nucleolar RNA-associated protein 13
MLLPKRQKLHRLKAFFLKKPKKPKMLKIESFDKIESVFTGAKVAHIGKVLISTAGNDLVVGGTKLLGHDTITCFCASLDWIIIAYQSLDIHIYQNLQLVKKFRAHEAPVLVMDFLENMFVTGSADGTIKVWDVIQGYCTHTFKGHSGIISSLKFHRYKNTILLASGSLDCKVRLWDLVQKSCIAVLDNHESVVRGLCFSHNGKFLYSASRDQCFCKWDIENLALVFTKPIFEAIEAICIAEYKNRSVLCTAGEHGVLKLWNEEELVFEQEKDKNQSHQLIDVM